MERDPEGLCLDNPRPWIRYIVCPNMQWYRNYLNQHKLHIRNTRWVCSEDPIKAEQQLLGHRFTEDSLIYPPGAQLTLHDDVGRMILTRLKNNDDW